MNSSLYSAMKKNSTLISIVCCHNCVIHVVELNFSEVKSLLESEMNVDDLELTRYPVDFFCRCCKDNFLKLLVKIGTDTLVDMQKKNERTLNCIYCNTNYIIDDANFKTLIS